jgi:MYXO-CTERM domain-containing protein
VVAPVSSTSRSSWLAALTLLAAVGVRRTKRRA